MQHIHQPIAVISGDIVNSTKLNSEQFEKLLSRIKQIQQFVSAGNAANAHSIARGDEFQSVVHDIESALRYTLIYRISIKALGKEFDSRISFAIAADAELREKVSESMGKAFVLSGRGLTTLKSDRLVFSSDQLELTDHFALLMKYLDRQLTALTSRQCEVLLLMLQSNEGMSVNDLAEKLGVATATASKSLKASGWPLISELNWRFINKIEGLKHG